MHLHYYRDDQGHAAIIYGHDECYTLVTFYHDQAVTYGPHTFERAKHLLESAGGEWTELPVRTSDEAVAAVLAG